MGVISTNSHVVYTCSARFVYARGIQFPGNNNRAEGEKVKSPTGPRLLLDSTALHCSAGCRPTPNPNTTANAY